MTREQRAKQFMPFDAMKGLHEALKEREERHSRVEKRELSEDEQAANSAMLCKLKKGDIVSVTCYSHFHEVTKTGTITAISYPYHFIALDDEKLFFDDIYSIEYLPEQ